MMAQAAITRTQFQERLKLLLSKDDRDCTLLERVYNDVRTCAKNNSLVREMVIQHERDFFENVEQRINDLKEVDRPILVIGESSAGKSSFLNLLIGQRILPNIAAPCTHCVCCIKKGEELRAHVTSFDGSDLSKTQIIRADEKSDKEFRGELQELVNEGNCEEALDRCIEIFVPSAILEDNVCLVDTPGFGENAQVTNLLVKYLPKAVGIIFILNPTVTLGIAEDRGVLILDEIKRLRKEGKIPSFDPTKILFIGNKWDQIPEEERQDHRLKMIRKMKTVWPNFQDDQLLHLSVNYCLKLQENKSSIPEDYKSAARDYQAVLDKIHDVVEHCCSARSQVHKRFLFGVFRHMKTFVDTTVTNTIQSVEEKQAKVKLLESVLKDMESKYKQGKANLVEKATDIQRKVVEDFHQYLNNVRNWQHIFPWRESNIPKGTEYCEVKEKAFVTIRAFITEAFTKRIAMSQPELVVLARILVMLTSMMNEMREQFENLLTCTGQEASMPDDGNIKKLDQSYSELTKGDIAALVLTAPLWIPLGIVGGIVGVVAVLPVTTIVDVIQNIGNIKQYRKDPRKYLDRWSEEIIRNEFSKEAMTEMVFQSLTIHITESMDNIEKTIETFKGLSNHIKKSVNEDKVPEGFYEIRKLCRQMDEKLNTTE